MKTPHIFGFVTFFTAVLFLRSHDDNW